MGNFDFVTDLNIFDRFARALIRLNPKTQLPQH
jgi:hypothetical protein